MKHTTYKCQFCLQVSLGSRWLNHVCPQCGKKYQSELLSQEENLALVGSTGDFVGGGSKSASSERKSKDDEKPYVQFRYCKKTMFFVSRLWIFLGSW
jgi:hypothetical protein